ncbi:MAG: hypothetical protein CMJ32_01875 [Phycisphaerae bacterium]|nr:hypothetical protein [Phycisphaerae bacterium]
MKRTRVFLEVLKWIILGSLLLLLDCWVLGRLCSDRWWWSQWLWWIPPLYIVFISLICTLACLVLKGWLRVVLCGYSAVVFAWSGLVLLDQYGWSQTPTSGEGITAMHWNVIWPNQQRSPWYARFIDEQLPDTDLIMVSNPGLLFYNGRAEQWKQQGYEAVRLGAFGIITRIPLTEARSLFVADGIHLAMIRLEPPASPPMVIYLVDLPSDPSLPRMKIARALAGGLHKLDAPPPDLVVGDFNITRNSASIRHIFPGMINAWDQAGHGHAGSFPRQRPMWHLDQVLVGPHFRCLDYHIEDAGFGRHRVQFFTVEPRNIRVTKPRDMDRPR